jgi:hypothetical protein
MRALKLIIVMIIFQLLCTACSVNGNPEAALWGKWKFVPSLSNSSLLSSDLEFLSDGSMVSSGNWLVKDAHYEYAMIAPGQIKISSSDFSEVVKFTIEGDSLTLYFNDGASQYYKAMELPPTEFSKLAETEKPPAHITEKPSSTIKVQETMQVAITELTVVPTERNPSLESTMPVFITPTPSKYFPLNDCPASQLRVGDSGFISYEGGKNHLRSTADTHPSNNIIGSILTGEAVVIIDGPVCNYGWVLWKVRTTRNETGWTAETDGNQFWVYPISTRHLCSDTLPTRVIVGKMAFVQEIPAISNKLRNEPEKSSAIIGQIQPGGKMQILEGPTCHDGSNWWKVQSIQNGTIGWTRENDRAAYYIAPIP